MSEEQITKLLVYSYIACNLTNQDRGRADWLGGMFGIDVFDHVYECGLARKTYCKNFFDF